MINFTENIEPLTVSNDDKLLELKQRYKAAHGNLLKCYNIINNIQLERYKLSDPSLTQKEIAAVKKEIKYQESKYTPKKRK